MSNRPNILYFVADQMRYENGKTTSFLYFELIYAVGL